MKISLTLVGVVAAAVALAGCGTSGPNPSNTAAATTSNAATNRTNSPSSGAPNAANKTITIGYMSWDEDVAATYLWKNLLEQRGYTVNLTQMGPGPVWEGLGTGSINVFFDTWMPYVDKTYWNKYGSNLVNLGQWYGGQTEEGLVVPDYMSNIKTMADLRNNAKEFGGTIVGIESGSIEMGQTQTAISTYHLPFTLQASSTPAMLAALQKAYQQKKPIVVTLWSPHWAFAKYKLHYIQDPKQVFGKPGVIDTVATKAWSSSHPTAIGWMKNFHLSVQQLGTLEEDIQQHSPNTDAGVTEWISQNQQVVNSWFQ